MIALYLLLGAVLAVFVGPPVVRRLKHRGLPEVVPGQHDFGKRRVTFRSALKLLEERGARVLVETGTARHGLEKSRSDGASTIVFGAWARRHGAKLHSVDLSPDAIEASRAAVLENDLADAVRLYASDSIEFLRSFGEPVDFLYLDSYDYSKTDPEVQRRSQTHHLEEFRAIEDRLHDRSVVLIDDCRLAGGGKGKLVVDYMRSKGWIVVKSAYQVLLAKQ